MTIADQLNRSIVSISANITEGYSRSTGKDRALFYQYALGSARESRDWYYNARSVLGEEVFTHRSCVIAEILRLMLTMIPQQRGSSIREEPVSFEVDSL